MFKIYITFEHLKYRINHNHKLKYNSSTQEYILQEIAMPKVLGSIIDNYTPDFECTFSDGRNEYLKNNDLNYFDFESVTSIIVYTQLVISRKVNFKCLKV